MRIIIGLFIPLLLTTPCGGWAASFDCSKASTKVEKMICNSAALSKADEMLAGKYAQALKQARDRNDLIRQQRQWLERRNALTNETELLQMYNDRIRQLDNKGAVAQKTSDSRGNTPRASKRAYLFSGDLLVLDTATDKIIETHYIRNEVRNIYDAKIFPKANAVIMTDDYRILKLNLKNSQILEDDKIKTQWENVSLLLSPDGNYFYVVWSPQHYLAEVGRHITQFDANLRTTEVEGLELPDSTHLIDFSRDGTRLYVVHGHGELSIRVINFRSRKVIREISFAEFGRSDVFTKTSADIKNNKLLIIETEKDNGSFKRILYVYDIESGAMSRPVKTSIDAHWRLMENGDKIICDEIERRGDMVINLDKLHIYDVKSGKEMGFVDMKMGADYYNDLAGITPDGKKIYYRTKKGINVIDAERFTVLNTLDIIGGLMSFAGY